MNPFKLFPVFAALVAAGCAGTPERTADSGSGQPAQLGAATAAAGTTEAVTRTIALDATELDASAVVTCRDVLRSGSNVIVTRCMTAEGWAAYKRFQTIQAKELLRLIRSSAR